VTPRRLRTHCTLTHYDMAARRASVSSTGSNRRSADAGPRAELALRWLGRLTTDLPVAHVRSDTSTRCGRGRGCGRPRVSTCPTLRRDCHPRVSVPVNEGSVIVEAVSLRAQCARVQSAAHCRILLRVICTPGRCYRQLRRKTPIGSSQWVTGEPSPSVPDASHARDTAMVAPVPAVSDDAAVYAGILETTHATQRMSFAADAVTHVSSTAADAALRYDLPTTSLAAPPTRCTLVVFIRCLHLPPHLYLRYFLSVCHRLRVLHAHWGHSSVAATCRCRRGGARPFALTEGSSASRQRQ